MENKTLALVLSLAILLTVIELVRREKLTFKYALGWMFLAFLAIFFAIFDVLLFGLARWFGFTLTSNFIFFTLLCFFVFLSLMLTTFLCQQNTRNDIIAQKLGILEMELMQLKEKFESKTDENASRR